MPAYAREDQPPQVKTPVDDAEMAEESEQEQKLEVDDSTISEHSMDLKKSPQHPEMLMPDQIDTTVPKPPPEETKQIFTLEKMKQETRTDRFLLQRGLDMAAKQCNTEVIQNIRDCKLSSGKKQTPVVIPASGADMDAEPGVVKPF